MKITERHKTNVSYGNLMSDKVEKRLTKNLISESCDSRVGHQVG